MNTKFVNNIDEFHSWEINIELDGGELVSLNNSSEPTQYPALIIWEWTYNTETNTQYVNYDFIYKSDFPETDEPEKDIIGDDNIVHIDSPEGYAELEYELISRFGEDITIVNANEPYFDCDVTAIWHYVEIEHAVYVTYHRTNDTF